MRLSGRLEMGVMILDTGASFLLRFWDLGILNAHSIHCSGTFNLRSWPCNFLASAQPILPHWTGASGRQHFIRDMISRGIVGGFLGFSSLIFHRPFTDIPSASSLLLLLLPPPRPLFVSFCFVFVRPHCTDTTMYGLRFMYLCIE